jgi:hypothetical protein
MQNYVTSNLNSRLNILFLTENVSKGSHTEDLLDGIQKKSNILKIINYYEEYQLGGYPQLESSISELLSINKFDYLIIGLGTELLIDPFLICRLSNFFKLKVIIIFPDPEHNFEFHDRYYAQCADLCWTFNESMRGIFELYGYNFFSKQGFSVERYPRSNIAKDINVSFIGGIDRANRREYIDYLSENGVEVYLGGHGSKIGLVSVEEKNSIIARSKIHLNFTGVENGKLNIFRRLRQQKGRLVEVSLIGTFILTEDFGTSVKTVFNSTNYPVTFNSKTELLEKVRFYLQNDDIRENLASNAYIQALNYETFSVFSEIIKLANSKSLIAKEFIFDDIFLNEWIGMRWFYFAKFLIKLKLRCALAELKLIIRNFNFSLKIISYSIARGIFHGLFR